MAKQPWIPRGDAAALAKMRVFYLGILKNPGTFGLQAGDAETIGQAFAAWEAAQLILDNPAAKTLPAVNEKNQARRSAELIWRQYATMIRGNAGITDSDKLEIGVTPPNLSRSRISVPESSPILKVIGATPGAQTLRYSDSNTPDSRARPHGAAAIQIFTAVSNAPVTDISFAQFKGQFSKNPVALGFEPEQNGKIASHWGRWIDAKGAVGPWSLPVSFAIAA